MVNVRFLNPDTIAAPSGYTHVVEVMGGHMAYISGQVALDARGNIVGEGDFRAQCQQVYQNVKTAVEAVGGSMDDIVKLGTFLTNMTNLDVLREVRREFLNANAPPASTTVEVSRLANEKFMVEIEAVVVLRTE